MTGEDERLLSEYSRRGDVKSLSALVVRNAKWLKALLVGLLAREDDADDAFQETWARVIRSRGAYRGGDARAYLARVARSAAIDRLRRDRRYVLSLDAEVAGEEETTVAETLPSEAPTPAEHFELKATRAEVLAAIAKLPQGQRETLLLRIEAELPFREIAEQLGVPLGTALTWMHAATERLKKEFGGER